MTYKLTPDDKEQIEYTESDSQFNAFFKNYPNGPQFKVGDILIKMCAADWDDNDNISKWEPEYISDRNKAPRKYQVIFENTHGMPYLKSILADGGLGDEVIALVDENHAYAKFELDPGLADHLLLADEGEKFDTGAEYKAKKAFRAKAYRANKKLMIDTSDELAQAKFITSLKVGDRVWMGHDMDQMVGSEYEITKISGAIKSNYYSSPTAERERWAEVQKKYKSLKDIKLKEYTFKCVTSAGYSDPGTSYSRKWYDIQPFVCLNTPPQKLTDDML